MLIYCLRRLLYAIPTIALVITITFTLGFYAPGDPIVAMYGEQMPPTPEAQKALRHAYGLDRPFFVQLVDYASKAVQLDFGRSLSLRRDVTPAMSAALPISLQMGVAALALLILVGVPLSILAATHRNSWLDHLVVGATVGLNAVPIFVMIPVIMLVCVLKLDLFDVPVGWHGIFTTHAILPVVVLTLGPLSWFVRTFRAALLEAMNAEHLRTARGKGLSERTVLWWHTVRNALPVGASAIALCVPGFFVGAIFVESIFAIPGFGNLTVQGLQKYDYPLILGTTIVTAMIVIISNLVADLVAFALDPGFTHG